VNTLLTELDGMENRSAVYVIAATNRPDIIDAAMLRPGRLDKLLYVQLPTMEERLDILQTLSKKTPLGPDVKLDMVASDERCENFSGADLASLVREAGMSALRTTLKTLNDMGKAGEKLDDNRGRGQALIGENGPSNDLLSTPILVSWNDFDTAFTKVSPSVSPQDKMKYDKLHVKFGGGSAKAKKVNQKAVAAAPSSVTAAATTVDAEHKKKKGSAGDDSDASL
jgi:ribosome biogenesis ATPase